MSSEFVGLRLNYKKDDDILEALDNAKNRSKEVKRLLRLGIAAANGELAVREVAKKPAPSTLDWKPTFEDKKPVAPKNDKKKIAANILGGFD